MQNLVLRSRCGWVTLASTLLILTSPTIADVFNWDDPNGGVYGVFNNWTPLGTPNETDTARFLDDTTYTVSFFQNQQAAEFHVLDGNVTFESGGTGGGHRAYIVELATVALNSELHIRRGADDKNLTVSASDLFRNRGTVSVAGGAALINTEASVDSFTGSSVAQLRVSGASHTGVRSLWEATDAVVGDGENGSMLIEDGGSADINGQVVVGASAGSDGEVTVTGQNADRSRSELSVFGDMTIGDAGTGRLLVRDGARADVSSQVHLGNSHGGHGTVTVEGDLAGGSARLIAGGLFVYRGDVFLNGGGTLISTNSLIGNGATSSVTVTGSGAAGDPGLWIANGTTTLGDNAEMILNISQGGVVDASSLYIGQQVGGLGRINLTSANATERSRFSASDDVFLGGNSLGPGGLAILTVNQNSTVKLGATTTIYAGSSITLNSPSSHLITDTIDNTGGGSFNFLSGTLNTRAYLGDLLNQGGTLSPHDGLGDGSGTGLTAIDGDYTQQAGATLAIDINGQLCGISYDHLSVDDFATLGGDLRLTLISGFAPQPFDTFDVLASDLLFGQFDNVAPGERLTTSDGLGSFLVNYGANSPFNANQVVLSGFRLENVYPGDYDGDEFVSGNDFLLWQRTDGTLGGLSDWQTNYGTQAPAVSALTSAVPEPASVVLVLFGLVISACQRCTT